MPDADWVVAGAFTSINGAARLNLARLNADGSVDAAWNPGADGTVHALVASGSGEVFVGGQFTLVGGVARTNLAKLSGASATVSAWQAGLAPEAVGTLALDASGRLLVGGRFGSGPSATYLKRFAAVNGAVDAGFTAAPDAWVRKVLVETGGCVLIAGDFANVSGSARRGFARLEGNGQLLGSFDAASDGTVTAIAVGSGGVLYVGGYFTQIGGAPRAGLAKLGSTGSADLGWDPGGINGPVETLTLDSDRLYIGGQYTLIAGVARKNLARIDAIGSGALDASWTLQADNSVRAMGATATGELWLGGFLRHIDAKLRMGLARLTSAAVIAPRVDAEVAGTVSSIQPLSGGGAVIAGRFLKVDGAAHRYLARLNADGSVDHAFIPQANSLVMALAAAGNALYIGGSFTDISGTARTRLAKLDATTGLVDPTWAPAADNMVQALVHTGSELLAGGVFQNIGGIARPFLARLALTGSGSADAGFNAQPNAAVHRVHYAGADRLLISGYFSQAGGAARAGVGMVSTTTGIATAWNAQITGDAWGIATDASGRV